MSTTPAAAASTTLFTRPSWAPKRRYRGWTRAYDAANHVYGYLKRGGPESIARWGSTWDAADTSQKLNRLHDRFRGKGMYMGSGAYRRRRRYTTRRIRRLRSGRMRYYGRGGYFGRLFGRILGTPFGLGDAGEKFGDSVGDKVSDWFKGKASDAGHHLAAKLHQKINGKGEYTVNSTVDHPESAPSVPTFHDVPDMSVVKISHREYLGEVYGPPQASAFQNTTYALNPGVERTFPWLAQIAANFEEYTLHQCMFTFRSTVADFASSTGQVGQVIAATQYNATAQPFTDKAAMMQYDGAMSTKTSQSMLHGVECDPAKLSGSPGKFVRVAPVLASQDLNEYDHGVFNIAVADIPSGYVNQSLGELWISYTVELRKPRFFTGRGFAISRDVFQQRNGYNTLRPFGTTATVDYLRGQQNSIGCQLIQYSATTTMPAGLTDVTGTLNTVTTAVMVPGFQLKFPANYAGKVKITFLLKGTVNYPTDSFGWFNQGNITAVRDIANGATNIQAINNYSTTWGYSITFDINVSIATQGRDNILYFYNINAAPGASTSCFLDVMEYNTSLNYKQDGSNDSVVWVNNADAIVI